MTDRHDDRAHYSPDEAAWFRGKDVPRQRRRLARGTAPLGVEAIREPAPRPSWWRRLLDEFD